MLLSVPLQKKTVLDNMSVFCHACRCGMVYIDPGDLRWKPLVQTWLDSKFPAKLSDATKVCPTPYADFRNYY